MVVGVAFLSAGLLILLLPSTTSSPAGFPVACGNGVGLGFDAVAVKAQGAALVEICARLRAGRLGWAVPVLVVGALVAVGGLVVRRRSPGQHERPA